MILANIFLTCLTYDIAILKAINHNRIPGADSFFIFITNTTYLTAILIAVGIILMAYYRKQTALKYKGWQILTALAFNTVIITILKYTIHRERPYVDYRDIEKLVDGGGPSFPSGHSADAFLMAVCITLLFNRKKWFLCFIVWIWALLVAYSRMALGVHYPSDLLGSMILGTVNALIVHRIFFKIKSKTNVKLT